MELKTVNIHGNDYVPVAERVKEVHADEKNETLTIRTELLSNNPVLFKATVITKKGEFTGHSAANPNKSIEKQSPYEVAETSAVGRALGFAGYGIVDSIASADEMNKGGYEVETVEYAPPTQNEAPRSKSEASGASKKQVNPATAGQPATEKQIGLIRSLMEQKGYSQEDLISDGFAPLLKLTKGEASECVDFLMNGKSKLVDGQPVDKYRNDAPPPIDDKVIEDIPWKFKTGGNGVSLI